MTRRSDSTAIAHDRSTARTAAAALAGGAIAANAAFLGLGAVFGYPDVLLAPTAEIVERFQANRTPIMVWFAVLAVAAALLAPGAVALGRLTPSRAGRWSVRVGVAAAAVQVVGLARWLVVVPSLAAAATNPALSSADRSVALDRVELAHTVGGKVIGETLGYTLTAAWTVLVLLSLPTAVRGGRVAVAVGGLAAGLVLCGVLTPFGVPGTDLANFVGYVLWSGWIVVLAVRLVLLGRGSRPETAGTAMLAR